MSRQLDSLLKGLSVFKEGMTELATSKAIEDANQQLAAARLAFDQRDGMTDEQSAKESKLLDEQRNNIAQNLMGRLAAIGTPASRIEAARSFGLTRKEELNQEFMREQTAASLVNARTKASSMTAGEEVKGLEKIKQSIGKRTKTIDETIDKASTAKALLEKGGPIGDTAIRTFLAKASGEVGNLTEAEREQFGGSMALQRRVERWMSLAKKGRLPESDRKDLMQFINVMENRARADKRKAVLSEVKSGAGIYKRVGLDEQTILQDIAPDIAEEVQAIQDTIQQLETAKKQFPARAKEIEARIQQLRQGM